METIEQLRLERDLFRRLLELGAQDSLEPFLDEALKLVTELAGAHQGYLELVAEDDEGTAPRWWAAHGFSGDEVESVRGSVSGGIIAEALLTGETIVASSALRDRRFEEQQSVRLGRIEAVICAPIVAGRPLGVIYLQRRREPGPFSDEDRRRVETFARHVAPFADRLVARELRNEARDETRPLRERLRLDGIVGRSPALAAVLREVALVAPLDVDVLLTGDSGTGKTQMASAIHENSPRAGRPFVELNCAAIPETLVESELFGALPGAHSTASRRLDGKVAAAERGTLFLDEIGELSLAAQSKLLQLLQSRIYYPLGATKAVRADLRVIAATNTDLEAAVAGGRFREDLFYRLHVLPIRVPSLAERREDVADLARHFCAQACSRHRLPRVTLSEDLLGALQVAEWPGNVRQLAHAVEAAVIRAAGGGALRVERDAFFRGLQPARPSAGASHPPAVEATVPSAASKSEEGLTFQEATRRFQAEFVRQKIEESGWNIVEASRRLEVTRSHVYTLIRAFGIKRGS